MSTVRPNTHGLSIRKIDPEVAQDIRMLASRFRVTQGQVLEEAVWYFQTELGKSIPLPEGWTKPRDF